MMDITVTVNVDAEITTGLRGKRRRELEERAAAEIHSVVLRVLEAASLHLLATEQKTSDGGAR